MSNRIEKTTPAVQRTAVETKRTAETPTVAKPAITSNNSAVTTNRATANEHARLLRTRLNNQFNGPAPIQANFNRETAQNRAEELIKANGGRDDLDTDAVGRELAEIAKTNPADALAVTQAIYADDRIRSRDRDEVAQSFVQSLSDHELESLAATREGQQVLGVMQDNLLGGRVHGDEAADADRVRTALDKNGIFLGSGQGMASADVYPQSVLQNPDATPAEAAASIKLNSDTAQSEYIAALAAHQGDAAWLAEFHSALGADRSGELIAETMNPTRPDVSSGYVSPETALEQVDIVRNAIETMVAGGVLTQDGMNNLISGMPEIPHVATELFAKSNDAVKTMFFNAAVNDGADTWEAGALHVLNTMPASRQQSILNGLGPKLDEFIAGAMAGQQEIYSFADAARLEQVNEIPDTITYGGIEKLLETANSEQTIFYPRVKVSTFTEGLQQNIFNAVAGGLENDRTFSKFAENTPFKDELSELFIRNRDDLFANAQKNANGGNSGVVSDDFENGIERFFQMTLMTPPPGEKYEELAGSVYSMINEGVAALNDPALANRNQAAFDAFTERFGMEPTQYAQMLGGVVGSLMDATGRAQEAINDSNAQREAMIKFYTGLAFAMIPGAGDKIGKLVGEGVFRHFVEEGVGYFQSQAQDSLENSINDLISGRFEGADRDRAREINSLVRSIFDDGLRALPNGASISGDATREQFDFQGYFQRGFDNTSEFTRFDDALND